MNFFETCLYFKKNKDTRIPDNTYIKLMNYYGISDIKIKDAILIAIILGVNLNLYCGGTRIEIRVKNPDLVLNYLYYNRNFFLLINMDDFSRSTDYCKINQQIF